MSVTWARDMARRVGETISNVLHPEQGTSEEEDMRNFEAAAQEYMSRRYARPSRRSSEPLVGEVDMDDPRALLGGSPGRASHAPPGSPNPSSSVAARPRTRESTEELKSRMKKYLHPGRAEAGARAKGKAKAKAGSPAKQRKSDKIGLTPFFVRRKRDSHNEGRWDDVEDMNTLPAPVPVPTPVHSVNAPRDADAKYNLAILLALLFGLGFLANVIALFWFLSKKFRTACKDTTSFLLNLAVSDVVILLIEMVVFCAMYLEQEHGKLGGHWAEQLLCTTLLVASNSAHVARINAISAVLLASGLKALFPETHSRLCGGAFVFFAILATWTSAVFFPVLFTVVAGNPAWDAKAARCHLLAAAKSTHLLTWSHLLPPLFFAGVACGLCLGTATRRKVMRAARPRQPQPPPTVRDASRHAPRHAPLNAPWNAPRNAPAEVRQEKRECVLMLLALFALSSTISVYALLLCYNTYPSAGLSIFSLILAPLIEDLVIASLVGYLHRGVPEEHEEQKLEAAPPFPPRGEQQGQGL